MMASRSLDDLHPDFKPLVEGFLEGCQARNIEIIITCTYRSDAEQAVLYQQGRSTEGRIVTNCKAGQSAHNFTINGNPASKAIDIVPVENGKPQWDATDPIWEVLGELGEAHGIDWAGRWQHMHELAHFQMRDSVV